MTYIHKLQKERRRIQKTKPAVYSVGWFNKLYNLDRIDGLVESYLWDGKPEGYHGKKFSHRDMARLAARKGVC